MIPSPALSERPIGQVPGTCALLPDDLARHAALETLLLDRFARAGYRRLKTPILEPTELHERKSGATIVGSLFQLSGGLQQGVCLRPELTAGIVRTFADLADEPPLPWRVSYSGPVFRDEDLGPGFSREFHQVGVELIGAPRPTADGEVIWLADWSAREAGAADVSIRVGHVGLVRELLERSGLPQPVQATLFEVLGEAAARGEGLSTRDRVAEALERHIATLSAWLHSADARAIPVPAEPNGDDAGLDRLFRTLHPDLMGRRTGGEIIARLRRKWDLGHSLSGALSRVRGQVGDLADFRGPAPVILDRLARGFADAAPASVAALGALVQTLRDHGIDPDRVELDLGFGRGLGFYSQMTFVLSARTRNGPVEICGGGRYDGLARAFGSSRDDRGVGFAFGLERLATVLREQAQGGEGRERRGVLVVPSRADGIADAVQLATALRAEGIVAVLETDRSPSEATDQARGLGLGWIVSRGTGADLTVADVGGGKETTSSWDAFLRLVRAASEGRRS